MGRKSLIFIVSYLFTLICPNLLYSQGVGINTENPKGVFHLDGQGDNATNPTAAQQKNDVIIDATGKVGIGTTNPTEKLHVEGGSIVNGNAEIGTDIIMDGKGLIKNPVKMKDSGTIKATVDIEVPYGQVGGKIESTDFAPGKYLTSDEYGNASWVPLRPDSKIVGMNMTTGQLTPLYNSDKYFNNSSANYVNITDNPLILDKGKWLILSKFAARGSGTGTQLLVYMCLESYAVANPSVRKEEVVFGFRPETSGYRIITPQLFHMVQISEPTRFEIKATIGTSDGFYTIDTFGGSYFCAVRLDDR